MCSPTIVIGGLSWIAKVLSTLSSTLSLRKSGQDLPGLPGASGLGRSWACDRDLAKPKRDLAKYQVVYPTRYVCRYHDYAKPCLADQCLQSATKPVIRGWPQPVTDKLAL